MKYFSLIFKLVLFAAVLFFKARLNQLLIGLGTPPTITVAILNFILFVLGLNLGIISLNFLYRKQKKLASEDKDNVILGLNNVFYLLLSLITPKSKSKKSISLLK